MKYETIEGDTDYKLFHILFRIEFSFYGTNYSLIIEFGAQKR